MQNSQAKAIKVYFEVTNYCNFRSDFCPSAGSKRKGQHMDFALFQKGIEDVVRDGIADTVGFHILGEPLLYPMIFDALCYAKSKGLRTEVNTNGSLLTEDRVERLVAAQLDELCVSVQTVGEQEHACKGSSLRFETYYRRIMNAARLIKASGSGMDVVLCFMDTSTARYFDIDKPMRIGTERNVIGSKLAPFIQDIYSAIGKQVPGDVVEAALSRMNFSVPKFVRIDEHSLVYVQPFADWGNAFTSKKVYPAKIGFCGYGLTNVGILNTGEVTICCADYDGRTSLGNLRTQSLGAILASEKARAIRDGFDKMKLVHPYCQRCVGSPNRIKAMFKGLASIYLFRLRKFQPARVKQVPLLTG